MRKDKDIAKLFILIGVVLFLLIPILQKVFKIKTYCRPLFGTYVESKDTIFTIDGWFNGRYAETKNVYMNEHFGLRSYYVMLNNQLHHACFNLSSNKRIIVGKGDFLYEIDYTEAYYGNNFVGTKALTEKYKKLKQVQDYLSSIGVDLEVVFLPSKASFYPEFIPENYRSVKKITNYDCASILCQKLNINYVDFSLWFRKLKDISPYDLYPKTGIHWSNYGALIATDSLVKHIEYNTKLKLRHFNISNVSFSDSLLKPDNDMGELMNLLFQIKTLPMPYANYSWKEDATAIKPKTLVIGDSYYWNIYYQGLANNLFAENNYWYYNKTVYPENAPERDVQKLNLLDEIKKHQIIILMATEINIHDIGWGFVEQVYDLCKDELKNALRQKVYVKLLIDNIRNDKQWLSDVERKAKEKNISVEEMMTLDAIYVYKMDYCKPEVTELLDKTVVRIKNTKEWVADITKKAKEKNLTVEEMIELDAKYIYDTELKQK